MPPICACPLMPRPHPPWLCKAFHDLPPIERHHWGVHSTLHRNPHCEIAQAGAVEGGFCSIHRHRRKHNTFQVLRGCLVLDVFTGHPDRADLQKMEVSLMPGNRPLRVSSGMWHRFRAWEPTLFLETYDGDEPEAADIERVNEGGIKD